MEKIQVGNKTCLYLNHQKLMENSYKKIDFKETFQLKKELFNFTSKVIGLPENTLNPNEIKNTKRKRKAGTEAEDENTLKEKSDIQPFLNIIQSILKGQEENKSTMPRVWENHIEFPQFRGANNTALYQNTKFTNEEYIIPPNTKFFNYNIEDLPKLLPELEKYDVLIMDMPWQNKYIRRLKKVKQSLAYQLLDNEVLKKMPIQELIHPKSLVILWCTNALQHRKAIEEEFLPCWNLKLLHTLKWYKINTSGELISSIKTEGFKQPYELLYIACHKERNLQDLQGLAEVDFLVSIPSIIHSHKPPLIEWLNEFLQNSKDFKGLEIFARYLQPQFTSIGLEVLKLMNKSLYTKQFYDSTIEL